MKNKFHLKENSTLKDYQKYVKDLIVERGFEETTIPQLFKILMEDVIKLSRLSGKSVEVREENEIGAVNLKDDVADVFEYLIDVCKKYEKDEVIDVFEKILKDFERNVSLERREK